MPDFSDLGGTIASGTDFSDLGGQPVNAPSSTPSLGSRLLSGAGKVGQIGLETLAAPFQMVGEAIRTAGEGGSMRAPSIVQRFKPSSRTAEPPTDPFTKAYQGLEGITQLPSGI